MIRRPPRSTLFPYTRSSDLGGAERRCDQWSSVRRRRRGLWRRSWSQRPRGLRPCNQQDRKSTRLNSSHLVISYAVFCLKKKNKKNERSVSSALNTLVTYSSQ